VVGGLRLRLPRIDFGQTLVARLARSEGGGSAMAANTTNTGSGDLPFAKELFEAADGMRGSVESAE